MVNFYGIFSPEIEFDTLEGFGWVSPWPAFQVFACLLHAKRLPGQDTKRVVTSPS